MKLLPSSASVSTSCSKQSKSLCATQLRKDHNQIASRVFSVPLAVQHYVLLTLISLARIRPQVSLIKEQWRVTRSILSANSANPKPLRIIADMTERVFYHHIQFHFFHLVFSGDHATLCLVLSDRFLYSSCHFTGCLKNNAQLLFEGASISYLLDDLILIKYKILENLCLSILFDSV